MRFSELNCLESSVAQSTGQFTIKTLKTKKSLINNIMLFLK